MVEQGGITNIRQHVLTDIEGWKRNPPEGYTWHARLNNFYSYLPCDDYAGRGERAMGLTCIVGGILDVKNSVRPQTDYIIATYF